MAMMQELKKKMLQDIGIYNVRRDIVITDRFGNKARVLTEIDIQIPDTIECG